MTSITATAPRPAADVQVAEMHIFGASNQPAPTSDQSIQQSNVTVIGILSASEEEDSLALLSVDGAPRTLALGQSLPDGEILAHIEPATVVLERNGESRRIDLDIRYADSAATFPKAGFTTDRKNSWADAYIDGSADSTTIKHTRGGILSVPAALPTQDAAVSLQTIREARRSHFDVIRSKPGAASAAAPPD